VPRGGNGLMPVVVAAPIFEVRNSRGLGGGIHCRRDRGGRGVAARQGCCLGRGQVAGQG
jgi:hypothetical protein